MPLAEASITLDAGSEGPFIPGSRLSGKAALSPTQHLIRSANVILFGHAVTHGARVGAVNGLAVSLDFADDANLFRTEVPMVQDGSGSWLFDLQFPSRTFKPSRL